MMLVMFFGTVEFSSAVAVDRKVTLIATGSEVAIAIDAQKLLLQLLPLV